MHLAAKVDAAGRLANPMPPPPPPPLLPPPPPQLASRTAAANVIANLIINRDLMLRILR